MRRYEDLPPIGDDDYGTFEPPPPEEGTSPLFWIAIAVAVLIAIGFIVLIIALVSGDGDDNGAPANPVTIDTPQPGARIPVGEDFEVEATVETSLRIEEVRLEIDGEEVDTITPEDPPVGPARFAFTAQLEDSGEHELVVIALLDDGSSLTSDPVEVIGEGEGGRIIGRANADVNVRPQPGQGDPVGVLERGEEVEVVGRTQDNRYLQVLFPGDDRNWVIRDAIDLEPGDLGRLPVVQVSTPTPTTTGTATVTPTETISPTATETPSPTATEEPQLPNLRIVDITTSGLDGNVNVVISNAGPGSLDTVNVVISLAGLTANPLNATVGLPEMGAGQSATFTFTIGQPVTAPVEVTATVDTTNAVEEADENDNALSLVLAPASAPDLVVLSVSVEAGDLVVQVQNAGSAPVPQGAVLVTVHNASNELIGQATRNITVAPDEVVSFTISVDGGVPASVTVNVDPNGTIYESNDQNNSITVTFE